MGYKKWDDEYEPPMTAIDWKARAEAAEARVAELENHLNRDAQVVIENQQYRIKRGNWRPHYEPPDTDEISYYALRTELAALKAATEWRPVTEPPTKAGRYHVYVDNWPDDPEESCGHAYYGVGNKTAGFGASDGNFHRGARITHWRPLFAPPQE